MGPWDHIQDVRTGDKHVYTLRHLAGSCAFDLYAFSLLCFCDGGGRGGDEVWESSLSLNLYLYHRYLYLYHIYIYITYIYIIYIYTYIILLSPTPPLSMHICTSACGGQRAMFGIRTQQGGEAGWTAISGDSPVYASLSLELHVHCILPGSLSNFSLSLPSTHPHAFWVLGIKLRSS